MAIFSSCVSLPEGMMMMMTMYVIYPSEIRLFGTYSFEIGMQRQKWNAHHENR